MKLNIFPSYRDLIELEAKQGQENKKDFSKPKGKEGKRNRVKPEWKNWNTIREKE